MRSNIGVTNRCLSAGSARCASRSRSARCASAGERCGGRSMGMRGSEVRGGERDGRRRPRGCVVYTPPTEPARCPARSADGGTSRSGQSREERRVQQSGSRDSLVKLVVPVPPGATSTAEQVATLPSEEPLAESELGVNASMWAIVLAGGIGSRFWPLSTSRSTEAAAQSHRRAAAHCRDDRSPGAAHSAGARARAHEP